MKRRNVFRGMWLLCGGAILFGGTLLGCGHDPNHGIDLEQARAAARRVHRPPEPGETAGPSHGG